MSDECTCTAEVLLEHSNHQCPKHGLICGPVRAMVDAVGGGLIGADMGALLGATEVLARNFGPRDVSADQWTELVRHFAAFEEVFNELPLQADWERESYLTLHAKPRPTGDTPE